MRILLRQIMVTFFSVSINRTNYMSLIEKFLSYYNRIKIRNSSKYRLFLLAKKLLKSNGYNICYNRSIRKSYNPLKKNILIAIESPEVVKHNGWLDKDMNFVAEISFANFYNLEHFYCCRSLYSTNDNFVNFDYKNEYKLKDRMISFIYSNKTQLPGHQLRHAIAARFAEKIDIFGSGTGKFLKRKIESLEAYKYQIVIENGKYPDYVSEKFFDCIKTKTVPIYYGGDQGLEKMGFNNSGWISFNTIDELEEIINIKATEANYMECLPYMEKNRKLLLEIRNDHYLNLALNLVMVTGYMHTEDSYHKGKYNELSFLLE